MDDERWRLKHDATQVAQGLVIRIMLREISGQPNGKARISAMQETITTLFDKEDVWTSSGMDGGEFSQLVLHEVEQLFRHAGRKKRHPSGHQE